MLLHEDEESVKIIFLPVYCDISIQFLACSYVFTFSTLISLEDSEFESRNKNVLMYGYNAGPLMAILISPARDILHYENY